jgi:hypothetical protein
MNLPCRFIGNFARASFDCALILALRNRLPSGWLYAVFRLCIYPMQDEREAGPFSTA